MPYKSKGKMMDSPNGMGSYKGNPMSQPKRVPKQVGPSGNPDQMKANKMLQQAHSQVDSLRGKAGM